MFDLVEHDEDNVKQQKEEEAEEERKMKQQSIWLIPYLVKHFKFLQSHVLKVSGQILDQASWSRSSTCVRVREASVSHLPFLQMVLACIKELDADKKDRADKEDQVRKSYRAESRTHLSF